MVLLLFSDGLRSLTGNVMIVKKKVYINSVFHNIIIIMLKVSNACSSAEAPPWTGMITLSCLSPQTNLFYAAKSIALNLLFKNSKFENYPNIGKV